MKSLSFDQILAMHEELILRYGGAPGLRDRGQSESAVAQPFMTFAGEQLYSDLPEKAAALCFSMVKNHPFVDGNKRVGYAAPRLFLRSNGLRIVATADEKVLMTLSLADGSLSRAALVDWIREHTMPAAES